MHLAVVRGSFYIQILKSLTHTNRRTFLEYSMIVCSHNLYLSHRTPCISLTNTNRNVISKTHIKSSSHHLRGYTVSVHLKSQFDRLPPTEKMELKKILLFVIGAYNARKHCYYWVDISYWLVFYLFIYFRLIKTDQQLLWWQLHWYNRCLVLEQDFKLLKIKNVVTRNVYSSKTDIIGPLKTIHARKTTLLNVRQKFWKRSNSFGN